MAQLFFVCGAHKSGTTWLQRLLDSHPQVVCSGEGHFVEQLLEPIQRVVRDYNGKLTIVAERVYEGAPVYPPLTDEDALAVTRGLILRRMSSRAGPETLAIGDKTPRYTHYLPELRRLFPRARFLNIVRHPYDAAVSRLHHALRIGMAGAMTPGADDRRQIVDVAARSWSTAHTRVSAFRSRFPEIVCQLRYEDLLARPEAEAAKAFEFLGVPSDEPVVAAAVQASSFEAMSGRRAGEEDPLSFFRKGVAGDWQGRLVQADFEVIDALCAAGMAEEGYATASESVA